MTERKTSIGQIEILPATGHVQVRLHIQLFEDGVPVGSPHYHRTVMEPDTDIDAQMKAVNEHLTTPEKDETGKVVRAPIGPALADWSDIHAHAKIARKAEIVAAHKAAKEKRLAEEEARQQAMAAERAKAQGNSKDVPVPGLGGLPT